jgi:hypothetical protein
VEGPPSGVGLLVLLHGEELGIGAVAGVGREARSARRVSGGRRGSDARSGGKPQSTTVAGARSVLSWRQNRAAALEAARGLLRQGEPRRGIRGAHRHVPVQDRRGHVRLQLHQHVQGLCHRGCFMEVDIRPSGSEWNGTEIGGRACAWPSCE